MPCLKRHPRHCRVGSIMQAASIENVRHVFFHSRRPGFGLLGCGKIKDVSSLPSRRQCLESLFQRGDFIQPAFQFFRKGKIRGFLVFHFQPGFFHFDGFTDISFQDGLQIGDFSDAGEPDFARRLRVLPDFAQDATGIF